MSKRGAGGDKDGKKVAGVGGEWHSFYDQSCDQISLSIAWRPQAKQESLQ